MNRGEVFRWALSEYFRRSSGETKTRLSFCFTDTIQAGEKGESVEDMFSVRGKVVPVTQAYVEVSLERVRSKRIKTHVVIWMQTWRGGEKIGMLGRQGKVTMPSIG